MCCHRHPLRRPAGPWQDLQEAKGTGGVGGAEIRPQDEDSGPHPPHPRNHTWQPEHKGDLRACAQAAQGWRGRPTASSQGTLRHKCMAAIRMVCCSQPADTARLCTQHPQHTTEGAQPAQDWGPSGAEGCLGGATFLTWKRTSSLRICTAGSRGEKRTPSLGKPQPGTVSTPLSSQGTGHCPHEGVRSSHQVRVCP